MSHSITTKRFPSPNLPRETKSARVIRRPIVFHAWVAVFFGANFATIILIWSGYYFWAVPVFFLSSPWYAFQILKPSAHGFGPVVTRFATKRREVWLTIDDGPDPSSTPKILDLLDDHGARATFFLIGEKIRRHPALVTEILRRGHTVGNHTHTHPCSKFWVPSAQKTAIEIDNCADALRAAGASGIRWFRSPVGLKNHALHPLLAQRGLDLVLWSARGFDTSCHDPAKVVTRIAADLQPGAIILIHENMLNSALQLELFNKLFSRLKHEGYACIIPSAEDLIREG